MKPKFVILLFFFLTLISLIVVFSSFTKTNSLTDKEELPVLAIEGKKFGLRDAKTGKLLTEIKYDYIGLPSHHNSGLGDDKNHWFANGYEAILINDKWGIIDKNGKEIVDPTYYEYSMKNCSEGFVAVEKEGKWAFMSLQGKMITDFKYDEVKGFSEGRAAVGRIVKKEKLKEYNEWSIWGSDSTETKWGFIDTNGKEIIPLVYNNVSSYGFSEGLALVDKNQLVKEKTKLYTIDRESLITIKAEKIEIIGKTVISSCCGNYPRAFTIQSTNEIDTLIERTVGYVIDKNSKVVFEIPYAIYSKWSSRWSDRFENNLLKIDYKIIYYEILDDRREEKTEYRSTLFNKKGNDLTSHKYQNVSLYDNGFVRVKNDFKRLEDSDSSAVGLLDNNLNEIIPLGKYEEIQQIMYEGKKAFAAQEYYKQLYHVFDLKGNLIGEINGRANLVKREEVGNYISLEKGDKYGLSLKGKEIFPTKYEDYVYFTNEGELTSLKLNGKYALANNKGKILSEFVYDKLNRSYQNCYKATIEDKEFYINDKNECMGNCPDKEFLKKYDIKQAKFKN